MTILSPEERFLLHCLSVGEGRDTRRQVEEWLRLDLDWDAVVEASLRQQVAPLLYHSLQRMKIELPQQDLTGKLQQAYFCTAGDNTLLFTELAEILRSFHEAGIGVIVLKGAALAKSVYPNVAIRPMIDIDLLVRQADLQKSHDKLLEMGYESPTPVGIEGQQKLLHHLHPFVKPHKPVIEIHWALMPVYGPFKVDTDSLWQRAQPAQIAGVPAMTLGPEDLLLHLCLHCAYGHRFRDGLRSLCDIDRAIHYQAGDINWQQVCERAGRWGAAHSMYLMLRLSGDLLGTEVPPDVLDALKPEDLDPELIVLATNRILARREDGRVFHHRMLQLLGNKRFGDKVRVFLELAFPSREFLAREYSVSPDSKSIWRLYPLHWKNKLIKDYRIAWGLLRGDERTPGLAAEDNALLEWLESG